MSKKNDKWKKHLFNQLSRLKWCCKTFEPSALQKSFPLADGKSTGSPAAGNIVVFHEIYGKYISVFILNNW